jgi:hypothetical protein
MTPQPRIFTRRLFVWAAVLSAVSLTAGYALGAVTVTSKTLFGGANYLPGSNLGWFTQSAADSVGLIPSTVPTKLSSNVATPTGLGTASASFTVNTATASHTSVRWNFTVSTSAPTSTEIELTFIVVLGTSFTSTTTTVYATTNTALSSAITITTYFDAGTSAPIVDSLQVIVQLCPSSHVCP